MSGTQLVSADDLNRTDFTTDLAKDNGIVKWLTKDYDGNSIGHDECLDFLEDAYGLYDLSDSGCKRRRIADNRARAVRLRRNGAARVQLAKRFHAAAVLKRHAAAAAAFEVKHAIFLAGQRRASATAGSDDAASPPVDASAGASASGSGGSCSQQPL